MSGSHSFPRLSRRTTLGAALAVSAVVSGCSLRSSSAGVSAPSPSAPLSPAAGAANPDQPLVDRVVAALGADAGAPADFRTLHAAQVEALGGSAGGSSTTAPGGDWKSHQKQLLTTLVDAAVAAQDPQLVTLLASCAAAQRQLLHGRGLA